MIHTIIDGKLFDITNFVHRHPGGNLIYQAIDKDCTYEFMSHHHEKTLERFIARNPSMYLGEVKEICEADEELMRKVQRMSEGLKIDPIYMELRKRVLSKCGPKHPFMSEFKCWLIIATYIAMFVLQFCGTPIAYVAAFFLGMTYIGINSIGHELYHGGLRRYGGGMQRLYEFVWNCLEIEYVKTVYYRNPPIHLRQYRTLRQHAFSYIYRFVNEENNLSHAEHHAHTNTSSPFDSEIYAYLPMYKIMSDIPGALRLPTFFIMIIMDCILIQVVKCIAVTLMLPFAYLKNLKSSSIGELLYELISSAVFVTVSMPYGLYFLLPFDLFLPLLLTQTVGRFIALSAIGWGGHSRSYTDQSVEKSWAFQQITYTNNVVKPYIFGAWQRWFALDFPFMIEHHLFPSISTTTYGEQIRTEVLLFCKEHHLPYNVLSILDTWNDLRRWCCDVTIDAKYDLMDSDKTIMVPGF